MSVYLYLLSNKFSKAVFFANNQEFKEAAKEDQILSTACKVLIQNAIVLRNYLSLSQILANNENLLERAEIVELIKCSSMITWQHVNLHGEYDFTMHSANDESFDIDSILALKMV